MGAEGFVGEGFEDGAWVVWDISAEEVGDFDFADETNALAVFFLGVG